MKPRAGSKALIREINEALVLDVVRARGPVARAAIVARTGLSAATVTGIAAKLMHDGLLTETDTVRGSAGRPARLLALGGDRVMAAGVRLSPTEVFVQLANLRGEVVGSHREPLATTDPAVVVPTVTAAVRAAAATVPSSTLLGVGVAISGVVDHAGGVVRHSGALGWTGVPLRGELAAALGCPISIDSYVNSVALGLLLFDGRLAGRDLLVFSVGASLGASLVVRGRIHRGHNGSAGRFAHTRVGSAGRPCHCGALDCLETYSSGWGIQGEQERGGDRDLLPEAAGKLGLAMANTAKAFGPERVVIAYNQEMRLPDLVERTAQVFRAEYDQGTTAAPQLELATADESALARGAAYTILARMFTTDITDSGDATEDPLESVG